MLSIRQIIALEILLQRNYLFHWVPVLLAIGIVLYFARSFEPSVLVLAILLIIGLLGIIALICLGFAWAGYRVHIVKSTVLKHRD